MPVAVVTPPAPVVSLAEARAHLKVDWDDDDTLIETYIDAATGHLDGPSGWLGRALGVQTLRWTATDFGCDRSIRLPCPPVIEVVSVKYVDPAGAEQTLAVPGYGVHDALVWLRPGTSWPALTAAPDAVRIEYRAGFGKVQGDALVNNVPLPIKAAILLHVAHLYRTREAVSREGLASVPFGYADLLSTYRVY